LAFKQSSSGHLSIHLKQFMQLYEFTIFFFFSSNTFLLSIGQTLSQIPHFVHFLISFSLTIAPPLLNKDNNAPVGQILHQSLLPKKLMKNNIKKLIPSNEIIIFNGSPKNHQPGVSPVSKGKTILPGHVLHDKTFKSRCNLMRPRAGTIATDIINKNANQKYLNFSNAFKKNLGNFKC